jgi:hypothetical protein
MITLFTSHNGLQYAKNHSLMFSRKITMASSCNKMNSSLLILPMKGLLLLSQIQYSPLYIISQVHGVMAKVLSFFHGGRGSNPSKSSLLYFFPFLGMKSHIPCVKEQHRCHIKVQRIDVL